MASLIPISGRKALRLPSRGGDELKNATLRIGDLLDLLPVPLALWSLDRRTAIFNPPLRSLIGFKEAGFNVGVRWMARVVPGDRDRVSAEWKGLGRSQTPSVCCYRFRPRKRATAIWLRETAFLLDHEGPVCSHYVTARDGGEVDSEAARLQELFSGFSHEIANSLQMIGAEIELSRLVGSLSEISAQRIAGGLKHIRHLIGDITEYIAPNNGTTVRIEDPAAAIVEVMKASEAELAGQGIRLHFAPHERLPKLRLGGEFRNALHRLIEFSRVLLQRGGELTITARMRDVAAQRYLEVSIINAAPTSLPIKESEVFRPYLKVNQKSVGLNLTLARKILRRHCATVGFRKEQENCAVFSVLIEVPTDDHG